MSNADASAMINMDPTPPLGADRSAAAGSSPQRRWLRGRLGKSQSRMAKDLGTAATQAP